MPHIIVMHGAGKTEEQKALLTEKIIEGIVSTFGSQEAQISIGFKEVQKSDWAATVYEPEIKAKWDSLTKKPGYTI
jgi:4-oxalocrotonate tautomerase